MLARYIEETYPLEEPCKTKKKKKERELPEALVSFLYNLSGFLSICLSLPIISLCDVFRFGLRCVLDLGF